MGSPFGLVRGISDDLAQQEAANQRRSKIDSIKSRGESITGDSKLSDALLSQYGDNFSAVEEALAEREKAMQLKTDEVARRKATPGTSATILTKPAQAQGPLGRRLR